MPQADVQIRLDGRKDKKVTDEFGRLRLDLGTKEPEYLVITASKPGYAATGAF